MNFCQKCPRKLDQTPQEPCPAALERINARLADRRLDEETAPGCPWAINSAEYNYCFFNLSKELEGDPRTDKEICQLLSMTPATLDKVWTSILTKLQSRRNDPDVQEWISLLKDKIESKHTDDTIYFPNEFKGQIENPELGNEEDEELDPDAKLAKEIEDAADEKEKRAKRLKKSGMPVHRSGNKLDVFGLYSKKKLEEMKKNGKK